MRWITSLSSVFWSFMVFYNRLSILDFFVMFSSCFRSLFWKLLYLPPIGPTNFCTCIFTLWSSSRTILYRIFFCPHVSLPFLVSLSLLPYGGLSQYLILYIPSIFYLQLYIFLYFYCKFKMLHHYYCFNLYKYIH